jgi:hypothetical protein
VSKPGSDPDSAWTLKDIEAMIRSLKPERAWLEIARRRHQEIRSGKVTTVPGKDVFKKARSRVKR